MRKLTHQEGRRPYRDLQNLESTPISSSSHSDFEILRTFGSGERMYYRRKMKFIEGGQMHRNGGLGSDPTFAPGSATILLGLSTANSKPQVHLALPCFSLDKLTMKTEILKYPMCNHFLNIQYSRSISFSETTTKLIDNLCKDDVLLHLNLGVCTSALKSLLIFPTSFSLKESMPGRYKKVRAAKT